MKSNVEIAKSAYAAFAQGDIAAVLATLAPDAHWTEAEGGPYGGIFGGPQEVLEKVLVRLGQEWSAFRASPIEFVVSCDAVVTLGEYTGTFAATAKSFKAPFAHVWKFQAGRVVRFHQYTDTVLLRQPMQ